MRTRLVALVLSVVLVIVVVLVVATLGRGASDPTPTPAPPVATATAIAPPSTATATPIPPPAPTATSALAATSTALPAATQTQPATATAVVAPPTATATATTAPPAATATIMSPLPTPTALTSPLSPPTAAAPPTATPVIVTSSASLAINGQVISYSYPSGWALKQETKDRYTVVTLEAPTGALLTLSVYGVDMSPAQLSASLLEALKKQFSGVMETPLKDSVGGVAAEGYTVTFTHMGTPMTGVILSLRGGRSAVTLYTQAADADLGAVQARFDVVKNTLVVR